MTTIILTIIGILLAAAAALMVIFYGGDAFNSGTVGAQANQVQNAGTNVSSAIQMFKAERAVGPAGLAELRTALPNGIGAYLDEDPALPQGATASIVNGTGNVRIYQVTGVTGQVCARINTNLRNPAIATGTAVTAAGPKMGCVPGATPAAVGTFYARA